MLDQILTFSRKFGLSSMHYFNRRFGFVFFIIPIFSFSTHPSDSSSSAGHISDSIGFIESTATKQSKKDFIVDGTDAAKQFLRPGERQPQDYNQAENGHFYHNGTGNGSYQATVGHTNVSVGADGWGVVRFVKDLCGVIFGGQSQSERPVTKAYYAQQDKMFEQLKSDRKDFENRYTAQTETQLIERQDQVKQERRRVIDQGIEQGYIVQDKKHTRKVRRDAQKEYERLSYENRKLGAEAGVIERRLKNIEQNKQALTSAFTIKTDLITATSSTIPSNQPAGLKKVGSVGGFVGISEANKITVPTVITEIKEHKTQITPILPAIPVQSSELKKYDALKYTSPKLAHIMAATSKLKGSTRALKRPSVRMPSKRPIKVTSRFENDIGKIDKNALREAQSEAEFILYAVGYVARSVFDAITSDPANPRLDRFYRCTIDTFPHEINVSLEDIVKENYHTHLKELSTGRLIHLHDYADDFIDPKYRPLFFGYSEERIEQNKKMAVFGEHVREELKRRVGYSAEPATQKKFSWDKDIIERMAYDPNNFIEKDNNGYRYFAKRLETGEEIWLIEKGGRIRGSSVVIPKEIKITKLSPEEQVVFVDDIDVLKTDYTSLLANMSDKGLELLKNKSKNYIEKEDKDWNGDFLSRNWRYYMGMPEAYTLTEGLHKRVNDEIANRNAFALQEQQELELYNDDAVQASLLEEQISPNMPTELTLPLQAPPLEMPTVSVLPIGEAPQPEVPISPVVVQSSEDNVPLTTSPAPLAEVPDGLVLNNREQLNVQLKINNHINTKAFNTVFDRIKQAQCKVYVNSASVSTDCAPKQYTVTSDTVDFACKYGIAKDHLMVLQGTSYEQQLHAEFLEQLKQAKTISAYYALQSNNILVDTLCHGVAIGMEANRLHQPDKAALWATFGKEVLEIIEAVGEGIELFADNTMHMICHPIHTLVQTIDGLGKLTGLVARTTARAAGTMAHWHALMERGDGLMMAQEMDQVAYKVKALGNYYLDKINALKPRDLVKYGTACAADAIFTHKVFAFGGNLCARTTPVIRNAMAHINNRVSKMSGAMIEAAKTAQTESPVFQTAEGILMKASEDLSKIGGGATGVISSTRLALEAIHAEYMAGFKAELEALKLACDNKVQDIARFGNKYLKPEYEHILGMDLYFSRRGVPKLGGFHHDLTHMIEKMDRFKFVDKIVRENGCYSAKVYYGEHLIKDGTFFPAHWSREQVIEKIYEAYNNFVKSGAKAELEGGKYYIKSTTNEGIKIEMYITTNGHIKTAYPTF